MGIPGQQFTINENGTGAVDAATSIPLYLGYSSLGTANVLKTYSSIADLVANEGQGAAVEAAANDLAQPGSGAPIRFMKLSTSVASALSAVTQTGTGPAQTIAGTPNDDYQGISKIGDAGALGVGTFYYSLDNGVTWSEKLTIPAGGTYTFPNTGVTATFAAGSYVAGTTYAWTATAPMWNSSDLAAAFNVLATDTTPWDFVVGCGRQATGAAAATLAAALQTQLSTLANAYQYKAGMLDAGDEATGAVITAFASTVANRVLGAYRSYVSSSAKVFPGWAAPKQRLVNAFGQKAHAALISTDLARVKSGPIPGAASIEHNEQFTEVMDAQRISTARTIPNMQGFFITNGRMLSAVGSDFKYWQHRRIMDVGCRTVYFGQAKWLNADLRTNADGSIDERDAAAIETDITTLLNAVLVEPTNADGKPGHVSRFSYVINRTNNFLATGIVMATLSIQARGYVKTFQVTLGFVSSFPKAQLPAAA